MKTIIVTSSITYAPENYNDVLESVLHNAREHINAVILIKINLLSILGKVPYLYFSGCKNIADTLLRNMSTAVSERKEKLFKKYDVPFIYTSSINDPKIVSWIKQRKTDLLLNLRGRCIYKDTVLKIPQLGCVNVHHGILPQQRGLFCDLYALAEKRATGFTIHEMTNQIDQGKIFFQEKVEWSNNYMDYLARVSLREGLVLVSFMNQVAKRGALPEGIYNKFEQSIVTTTPNFKTIRRFQSCGMIL